MNATRAFIIHLERAASRRPTAERLRADLEIASEIVPAVDGASLTETELGAAYRRARFSPRYPFALGRAEIGAFLSHRAAWRRIVDEELDFGIVFEDDAAIDPRQFSALLAFLGGRRGEWDYVLTPAAGIEPRGAPILTGGGFSLLRPYAPPLRAIGQFVSRAAAERLLAVTEPFDRPVDTFLQMSWITGVPILTASPTPLRDVSLRTGGTTVQRRRMSPFDRLRHETLRPLYRARVLSLYRRETARSDWRPVVAPVPGEGRADG